MFNLQLGPLWDYSRHGYQPQNSRSITESLDTAAIRGDGPDHIEFENNDFNDIVVKAAIRLFRGASHKGHRYKTLFIRNCTGQVENILAVAVEEQVFDEIHVYLDKDLERTDSCERMRFDHSNESLYLSGMSFSTNDSVSLKDLVLNSRFFKELMGKSGHYKRVVLSEITFGHEDNDLLVAEFIEGLRTKPSLEKIQVCRCHGLTGERLALFVQSFGYTSSLKELCLQEVDVDIPAMEALCKLLANSQLEALILRQTLKPSQLRMLAKGLKANQHLRKVELASNDLVDEDLVEMIEEGSFPPGLEELDLSHNRFTDNVLRTLAFQNLSSLRRLKVHNNYFSRDEGPRYILRILQENPRLRFVDHRLHMPEDGSEVFSQIQHFEDFNKGGRSLLCHSKMPPLSLWPAVVARANVLFQGSRACRQKRRVNVLFHLLQGPALLNRTAIAAVNDRYGDAAAYNTAEE